MIKGKAELAPSPKAEAARLAALDSYGVLDTPAEQGFGDIVLLASQICETPVALVSLVAADRQWFKARIGFDACETSISQSVCAHTLWRPGLLIIPDLTADRRTCDNTLVTNSPHIRFYAGARLETPTGEVLGALCVIDTQARPGGLTSNQANALEALARQVMAQLELRRTVITLETRVNEKAQERSLTWQVSPDLIGVLNADAIFESTNPAWQGTLGWSEAEMASSVLFNFLHPDDLERNKAVWQLALDGNPVLNFENRYRCKNGSYRWLSWVAVPESDKIYCIGRDITDRKEFEASSETAKAMLVDEQATSALREQFIAVLGHDLRNPIMAIGSGMRLLLKTPLNERGADIVKMVQGSLDRMAALIENVMDFARGRLGGGLTLNRRSELLEPVLRHVIDELQTTAPEREIVASISVPKPIDCDRHRVGQLLSNLLGNALNYGAKDRPVRVGAAIVDGQFELFVANAGEPIPAFALANIFEAFSRGALRPTMAGLGLGLYISAQIARAHGGVLSVSSNDTETRFTFKMPFACSADESPAQAKH